MLSRAGCIQTIKWLYVNFKLTHDPQFSHIYEMPGVCLFADAVLSSASCVGDLELIYISVYIVHLDGSVHIAYGVRVAGEVGRE
jgi:hypothetical protein